MSEWPAVGCRVHRGSGVRTATWGTRLVRPSSAPKSFFGDEKQARWRIWRPSSRTWATWWPWRRASALQRPGPARRSSCPTQGNPLRGTQATGVRGRESTCTCQHRSIQGMRARERGARAHRPGHPFPRPPLAAPNTPWPDTLARCVVSSDGTLNGTGGVSPG